MPVKKRTVKVNEERCKGCMLCVAVCPRKCLEASGEVSARGTQGVVVSGRDACTGCGMCVLVCPDCAIEIVEEEQK
ncbi:MAG: 4Fe-4S binding protein [Candidatus Omnitrophota bacterium]